VVITANFTERLPAAPHATVGTNSDSTVSTFSHCAIAAGRPHVAITRYVFDLADLAHFAV
jgi:hypothetical protein